MAVPVAAAGAADATVTSRKNARALRQNSRGSRASLEKPRKYASPKKRAISASPKLSANRVKVPAPAKFARVASVSHVHHVKSANQHSLMRTQS
jgi:hypothetical protein